MTSEHRTVIVTGASSGIGRALSLQLLREGHAVVATGRDEERLAALSVDAAGSDRLSTIVARAESWPDNERAVAAAVDTFGGVDAVVANAGYTVPGTIRTADPQAWAPMVLTNVLGPAYLVRAALPHLERSRGRIVLVGSVAGHKNSPGNLYSATKWAITGLAENVRMEVAPLGIGVALVSPGVVDTGFYPGGAPLEAPLEPERIAVAIGWVLDQPAEVDVNTIVVRPAGQPF